MSPIKVDPTKKADPKAQALKAAKAVKSGAATFKKKAKKVRTSVTFHRYISSSEDIEEGKKSKVSQNQCTPKE